MILYEQYFSYYLLHNRDNFLMYNNNFWLRIQNRCNIDLNKGNERLGICKILKVKIAINKINLNINHIYNYVNFFIMTSHLTKVLCLPKIHLILTPISLCILSAFYGNLSLIKFVCFMNTVMKTLKFSCLYQINEIIRSYYFHLVDIVYAL